MQLIVMKSDNKIVGIHKSNAKEYAGQQHKVVKIPDQDVDKFYNNDGTLKEIYYPDDVQTQFDSPFLETDATYYATIANIDASRSDKKYVKVKRTLNGTDVSAWCYVTYSMLQAYQNSDLTQGDYVIVNFVDDDLGKPIIMDKVVGF